MGLIMETEDYGFNRMTKKAIVTSCKKNKLYVTPHLNDVLYLHFQGYQKIEDLEEYTGLKTLWLESNAITEISGLENQKLLKCLFLHNNLVEKIENLDQCKELDTLNLSYNQVNHISNCGSDILPVLNTLNLANNYLRTAESIEILRNCHNLAVLDLSNNRLDDILIVKIFGDMPALKVLVLTGNPVINDIPSYRKTLIVECKLLTYLDTRPVFPRDRACAEAWKRGGFQEERRENIRWNKEERREMLRSVNATLRMRNRGGGEPEVQLIPTDSSDDDEYYSREIQPKQCEDVPSNQQWNIMDEMMRNPESSDKYENCKICGSAYCKYQHIESHTVNEAIESVDEILESSNFSILWDDCDCIGNDNNTTICVELSEEPLTVEDDGKSTSSYLSDPEMNVEINNCSEFNTTVTTMVSEKELPNLNINELNPCDQKKIEEISKPLINTSDQISNTVEEDFTASKIIDEENICTESLTVNSAECDVSNTPTIVITVADNPEFLENMSELVKVSVFPDGIDSDDDGTDSIHVNGDVVSKLVDGTELLVENEKFEIIVEDQELQDNLIQEDTIQILCKILEDPSFDSPNQSIVSNEDATLQRCINVDEPSSPNEDKLNTEIENDIALHRINHASIHTIEHASTKISIDDKINSCDLSTLWEENSLVELDENDLKVDSPVNCNISNMEDMFTSIELCSINVKDASCSYQVKRSETIITVGEVNNETTEIENMEMGSNYDENIVYNKESEQEQIQDISSLALDSTASVDIENMNLKKKWSRSPTQENEFFISRIKKNCVELNKMLLESTMEANPIAKNDSILDDQDDAEELEDIDNSSRIDTLGYSTFVASFEQFFNDHELKSVELLKTLDFSSLCTERNDSSNDKVKESVACDAPNVDDIPAMKNFREYRSHLVSLLNRDSELRISCNELLNDIHEKIECIVAIDTPQIEQKPPIEVIETVDESAIQNDVSIIELPINTNNSLMTPSNSFYKICYDDPNSSLEYVSVGSDIPGNSSPDVYLDAVEEIEDSESSVI